MSGGLPRSPPAETRSVSVFLVNNRSPRFPEVMTTRDAAGVSDAAYAFQAETRSQGRPNPSFPVLIREGWRMRHGTTGWPTLHYGRHPRIRSRPWCFPLNGEVVDGDCHLLRTAWIPSATVAKTEPAEIPDAEFVDGRLGSSSPTVKATTSAMAPLVGQLTEAG